MADVKFEFYLYQDQAGGENATIDITLDGTTEVSGVEITGTSASPQKVEFTKTGLTEASHTMEVVFTNPYYVDADNDRNVIISTPLTSYTTQFDTYKTGIQKQSQDAEISRHGYSPKARNFADSWTALNVDGNDIANSGDSEWATQEQKIWQDRATITFNYANNGYNEYPYRNIVDADSTPPTLSTTVQIPYGDNIVFDPSALVTDPTRIQFAAE
jgi:hypothetical protein